MNTKEKKALTVVEYVCGCNSCKLKGKCHLHGGKMYPKDIQCNGDVVKLSFEVGWELAVRFSKDLVKNSKPMPPEYSELVDAHFDELI